MPSDSSSGVEKRTLPKSGLLTRPDEYQKVYAKGRRLRGAGFTLICLPNGAAASRLGISIHGVRRAVRRNRLKRIIRNFFRNNRALFYPPSDLVFAVRADFAADSPDSVGDMVRTLLASAKSPRVRPESAEQPALGKAATVRNELP